MRLLPTPGPPAATRPPSGAYGGEWAGFTALGLPVSLGSIAPIESRLTRAVAQGDHDPPSGQGAVHG